MLLRVFSNYNKLNVLNYTGFCDRLANCPGFAPPLPFSCSVGSIKKVIPNGNLECLKDGCMTTVTDRMINMCLDFVTQIHVSGNDSQLKSINILNVVDHCKLLLL